MSRSQLTEPTATFFTVLSLIYGNQLKVFRAPKLLVGAARGHYRATATFSMSQKSFWSADAVSPGVTFRIELFQPNLAKPPRKVHHKKKLRKSSIFNVIFLAALDKSPGTYE
jgi:hypothetical protein